MSEAELVKRCLSQDKEAWGIFVEKYSRLVYWAIRKKLSAINTQCDDDDVQDIFQEVFLMILQTNRLTQLKDIGFLPGWLSMTATHKTSDFIRKKIRQEQSPLSDLVVKANDFKQDLFNQDIKTTVKSLIELLSNKEKIVISLNLIEGRTHKEIADLLNMPINTVSTIVVRTKQKLKQSLEELGIGEDFLK